MTKAWPWDQIRPSKEVKGPVLDFFFGPSIRLKLTLSLKQKIVQNIYLLFSFYHLNLAGELMMVNISVTVFPPQSGETVFFKFHSCKNVGRCML